MTLANWISISNKGTLIKNDDCSKNLEEDSVETAMERHREETHCIRREKENYRIQFLLSFWYTHRIWFYFLFEKWASIYVCISRKRRHFVYYLIIPKSSPYRWVDQRLFMGQNSRNIWRVAREPSSRELLKTNAKIWSQDAWNKRSLCLVGFNRISRHSA